MSTKYGVLNFVKAADLMVNADTTSTIGLERFLITWFCLKFKTTPNDERLLEFTLEELLTFFYMHRLQEDPNVLNKMVSDGEDDYERWLKEEMAGEYRTDEQMVQEMLEYEEDQKSKRKLKDQAFMDRVEDLPDKITTTFPTFDSGEYNE
jgi:hypothetical protein